jgi:hypothetical protein
MVRNWVPFQEEIETFRSLLLSYGPSLYWALDDTDLAVDLSGNSRDGTASGPTIGGHTATFPPIDGEDPSCTDFDGTDDSVRASGSSYNPYATGTVRTFLGWFYRDTSTTLDTLFGGAAAFPNQGMMLRLDASGQDVSMYASATGVTWTAAWPGNGEWVFCVLVFDETAAAANASLYINDSLVETKDQAGDYGVGTTFRVGDEGGNHPWDGKMGHVAVVEGGLTGTQVGDLWTASGN